MAYNNLSLLRLRIRELGAQVQGEGCDTSLKPPVFAVLFMFVKLTETSLLTPKIRDISARFLI